jgi:transcriptional regulator with XRE-family HTH domain
MSNIYRKIGEKIAELRDREDLSQDDLARLLGDYTASSISCFESGKRKISIEGLLKIASIFDEDPSLFLNGGRKTNDKI